MAVSDSYEKDLWESGFQYIGAVDESGMGSFAGAVYVALVILPVDIDYKNMLPGLNDSKKKTAEQREGLVSLIKKHSVAYCIESASVQEIDELNIYWARFAAVKRALNKIHPAPDYVLMDGDKQIPNISLPQKAIVKGDAKSISIAAASILAKVARDKHIDELAAKVHQDYGWIKNKSYYSVDHVAAIKKHGKTPYHREKYVRKYLPEEAW